MRTTYLKLIKRKMTRMPKNSGINSFKEKKFFADRLAFVTFSVPVLLVSVTVGTILWAIWVMTTSPEIMGPWGERIAFWLIINIMVALPIVILSYPFSKMVDSSVCALVNSISNFKNIPLFTESPKLNVLLLVYGYKIRRFVSGGVVTDLVIDDRIKHVHKKVEDILSEPAVVDVIKHGKSRHFKKDVVVSVAKAIKGAIQEIGEISKNAKTENHKKTIKQNEESDQMVAEFLTRKN